MKTLDKNTSMGLADKNTSMGAFDKNTSMGTPRTKIADNIAGVTFSNLGAADETSDGDTANDQGQPTTS